MSARALSWLAALGVVVALAAAAVPAPPGGAGGASSSTRRAAYPPRFPDGPGHGVAQRSCLICHSAMLVTQQHKDSTGWEKTVKQMEAWGVKMTPAERDSLMAYLRGHFGAVERK